MLEECQTPDKKNLRCRKRECYITEPPNLGEVEDNSIVSSGVPTYEVSPNLFIGVGLCLTVSRHV